MLKSYEQLISGAVAGCSACLLFQPIDLVKTRLQQGIASHQPQTIIAITRDIIKHEGLPNLWNGLTPTLIRNVPGVALYFTALQTLRGKLATTTTRNHRPILGVSGDLIAGAVSRASVGLLLMPFTVIKTKAESSLYASNHSFLSIASSTIQKEGLVGLYRGFWVTMARDGPHAGVFVLVYERCRRLTASSSWLVDGISAGVGATVATLSTSPFDMIKTQRQLQPATYTSFLVASRLIYRNSGIRGFFAGSMLRIARKAGSSAVAWTTYEALTRRFLQKSSTST